jgi:hypothetical protein
MRIPALCLEFPVNHKVSRKTALCQMSESRPGPTPPLAGRWYHSPRSRGPGTRPLSRSR